MSLSNHLLMLAVLFAVFVNLAFIVWQSLELEKYKALSEDLSNDINQVCAERKEVTIFCLHKVLKDAVVQQDYETVAKCEKLLESLGVNVPKMPRSEENRE